MDSLVLLPGEEIPSSLLSAASDSTKPLTIGPGLRHIPPRTIISTTTGLLAQDAKKNALWVENNSGRYVPTTGDLVLCTVHHSSTEHYHCLINPFSPTATLPHLAFESATKKTRPILTPGTLVYARISSYSRDIGAELSCVNASTGKSDGLGPLKGGMLFEISLGMARRLMLPPGREGSIVLLDALAEKGFGFEIAVGRNGRVWVDASSDVEKTIQVGRAIGKVDEDGLAPKEQKKLADKLLRG